MWFKVVCLSYVYLAVHNNVVNKCDRLSKNLTCLQFFFFTFSALSAVSKEWITKVLAFCAGIIALDSRKRMTISL